MTIPTNAPSIDRALLAERVFCREQPDCVHLSPDGQRLSWTTTAHRNVVHVAPADDVEHAAIAVEGDSPIRFHTWSPDGTGLLHVRDELGTEHWQILRTDLRTRSTTAVSPPTSHADLLALSPHHPNRLLLTVDDGTLGIPHVAAYDLTRARLRRAATNPGNIDGWFADPSLRVRAATAATADGGFDLLHRTSTKSPWRTVRHIPADHALTTLVVALPDPTAVVLITSVGADTTRLAVLNTEDGQLRTLAATDAVDAERVLLHPTTGRPQAVSWYGDRRRWQPLDPAIEADLHALTTSGHDVRIIDRSRDDRHWLVALETSAAPTTFARWDRARRGLHPIGIAEPGIGPHRDVSPIRVRARDGTELHGYWRAPRKGRPPWPTVLMIHGGPWWRDTWEHDPWRDWINELGFACLQVNYRGSTGRGHAFAAAGVRRWGREVIDDLDDTLDWAVTNGHSDQRRLVAFGASFGGYAALMLATRRSVAAAAALNAPTDLVRFLEAIPDEHPTMSLLWRSRFGDIRNQPTRRQLADWSPLHLADQISCPVLLACGDHDSRIPASHTDDLAARLRALGREVRTLHLADEGHELQQALTTLTLAHELAHLLDLVRRHSAA